MAALYSEPALYPSRLRQVNVPEGSDQGSGKVADGGSGGGKACQDWRRPRFCDTIGVCVDEAELGEGLQLKSQWSFAGNASEKRSCTRLPR